MNDKGPMDQFSAHLDRGWDLVNRGDLAGALLSAEKGVELDAQSPEAHNLLGYVRAAQGQAEEALEHYRQAIALDETFVEAMLNAAEVLIHPLHDFDAALTLIEEALDFAEGDEEVADALLIKFDAFMHQGDRDQAARVARALPDGPFDAARLDFLVGRAKFEAGDVDGSLPCIERAVEREPDNADAHYYRGLLFETAGDTLNATRCFLRARDLDTRMPPAPWSLSLDQFERRVAATLAELEEPARSVLAGALVVVSDFPGAEAVVDGMDPRAPLWLDDLSGSPSALRVGRLFVYQRNLERSLEGSFDLDEELKAALEHELELAQSDLESRGSDTH